MPLFHSGFAISAARRVLCVLLALVVTVQGIAAGIAAIMGPKHVHRPLDRPLVLEDVRRHTGGDHVQRGGLSSWLGHLHAHASKQRHHHSPLDASVLSSAEDAIADAANVDSGAGSVAAFVALMPFVCGWRALHVAQPMACATLWAATSGDPERLERPPRAL